jgi:hypothetical protein
LQLCTRDQTCWTNCVSLPAWVVSAGYRINLNIHLVNTCMCVCVCVRMYVYAIHHLFTLDVMPEKTCRHARMCI